MNNRKEPSETLIVGDRVFYYPDYMITGKYIRAKILKIEGKITLVKRGKKNERVWLANLRKENTELKKQLRKEYEQAFHYLFGNNP